MATEIDTDADVIDLRGVMRRYRVGKTRANELVRERWFPAPLLDSPRRWSLDALVAAELRRSEPDGRARRSA